MKIVLGVDGSPHSRAALEFVRKLAWPAGSRVIVVSAVHVPVMVSTEVYIPSDAVQEVIKEEIHEHRELVSRTEQELRDAGLATKARVLQGDPRDALIQAAEEEGADLIVVGSHGRTGLLKLLMGSVASHVVTHAPCTVTVVKMERRRR